MATKLQPVNITRFRKIGHDIAQYHEPGGKHSKLFQYCNRAIRRGYSKFVFVCIEDTSGTVAFDVHSEEAESALDIRQIRSWFYGRHGYWTRLLPKRVKVVLVKIWIVDVDRFDRILVKTEKIDYQAQFASLERRIEEVRDTIEMRECGPIHNGDLHHGVGCEEYDGCGELICPIEDLYFLKRKVERLKVEEVQLSCYLDSRYASGSSGTLETANFIQDYRSCRTLQGADACIDIQSERGLQLESEWDKSQLCWIILAAFLSSLVVTGVSTGASRDWQIGLAAGGLVVALESFVVGAVAVYDKFR